MDLATLVVKNVNIRRDECGETFIFGKHWKTHLKRNRADEHHQDGNARSITHPHALAVLMIQNPVNL